jgi:hypothetical protein
MNTNTNNQEKNTSNYCKDLLGLWFCEPDCEYDIYLHAFSFDKDILNNMIDSYIKEEDRHLYYIKRVKLYSISQIIQVNKSKLMILPMDDNFHFNNLENPIYGFNKIFGDKCEQVLLTTNLINNEIIDMGISPKPIKIDTFYEESVLNA